MIPRGTIYLICVSKLKSQACNLAISRSCGTQSNAFDKSIKTASVNKLLSNAAVQFSVSLKSTWFVLYP